MEIILFKLFNVYISQNLFEIYRLVVLTIVYNYNRSIHLRRYWKTSFFFSFNIQYRMRLMFIIVLTFLNVIALPSPTFTKRRSLLLLSFRRIHLWILIIILANFDRIRLIINISWSFIKNRVLRYCIKILIATIRLIQKKIFRIFIRWVIVRRWKKWIAELFTSHRFCVKLKVITVKQTCNRPKADSTGLPRISLT